MRKYAIKSRDGMWLCSLLGTYEWVAKIDADCIFDLSTAQTLVSWSGGEIIEVDSNFREVR